MYQAGCRHFNGYKPCQLNLTCNFQCPQKDIPKVTILIVHLGAMGAVLRSTALLRMIKRKYPSSSITWVTDDSTKPLLFKNPMIDRVLGVCQRDQLILSGLDFDVGYFIDKAPEIAGIRKIAKPKTCFGFDVEPRSGAIIPMNQSALELWELGLDDRKKLIENKKTELQLIAEALELNFERDEYIVNLDDKESALAEARAAEWSENGRYFLVGLNTGTSGFLPHKTVPLVKWAELLRSFHNEITFRFVLLGGPNESPSHRELAQAFPVVQSSTHSGLRDGLCSVKAVDLMVTGDSLGMHMGIAFRKPMIVWFGPSCPQEIDLYDRGVKVQSSMKCSPCWKRQCTETIPCSQTIDVEKIHFELKRLMVLHLGKSIAPKGPAEAETPVSI